MDSERPAELPPEKPAHRHISLHREETGRYTITNARGGTLSVGADDADFTAVELLLSAIAACSSVDVDYVTGRRARRMPSTSMSTRRRSPTSGATTSRTSS
jgi:uncharacterized OsmC-like protein